MIRAAPARERCNGLARIRGSRTSQTRDTLLRYNYRTSAVVTLGESCPPALRALVAAHELGHVLGLNHERRRCSVMQPTLKQSSCSPGERARLNRELVADADLRAARALYPEDPADNGISSSASAGPSLGLFGWAAVGLVVAVAVALVTRLLRR